MVAGLPGADRRELMTSGVLNTSPCLTNAYIKAYGLDKFHPNPDTLGESADEPCYSYELSLPQFDVDDIRTILTDLIEEKTNDVHRL